MQTVDTFMPENPLEQALHLAYNDAAQRPAFFQRLLDSEVYVIGEPVEGNEDKKVSVASWRRADGARIIPFFTSLAAMRRAFQPDATYCTMSARTLFEITRGVYLCLNPESPQQCELTPAQVAGLLDPSGPPFTVTETLPADLGLSLAAPVPYPAAMVEALIGLLASHPEVRAAWVASLTMGVPGEEAQLVVGIETDGDFEALIQRACPIAAASAPQHTPLAMVQVLKDGSQFSRYFLGRAAPFYLCEGRPSGEPRPRPGLGARLRSLLGLGARG